MITVSTTVNAPIEKVWKYWTEPQHITKWNFAVEQWCCPSATNDLRAGGKFTSRMEAKDGSMGFDFEGTYSDVQPQKRLAYTIADGRKVTVDFTKEGSSTRVVESFEPESQHPEDFQKQGWQSILDNFKKYTEAN